MASGFVAVFGGGRMVSHGSMLGWVFVGVGIVLLGVSYHVMKPPPAAAD